jgi:hypothetical protein
MLVTLLPVFLPMLDLIELRPLVHCCHPSLSLRCSLLPSVTLIAAVSHSAAPIATISHSHCHLSLLPSLTLTPVLTTAISHSHSAAHCYHLSLSLRCSLLPSLTLTAAVSHSANLIAANSYCCHLSLSLSAAHCHLSLSLRCSLLPSLTPTAAVSHSANLIATNSYCCHLSLLPSLTAAISHSYSGAHCCHLSLSLRSSLSSQSRSVVSTACSHDRADRSGSAGESCQYELQEPRCAVYERDLLMCGCEMRWLRGISTLERWEDYEDRKTSLGANQCGGPSFR